VVVASTLVRRSRRWLSRRSFHPLDALAVVVALAVGAVVLWVSMDLFAYHSVNDDEGVYLLQAAMLLEGKLFLTPPADIADLVRPWFFVEESTSAGPQLYPKYAPVPAAMFAVGMLLGEPRLTLGAVAAGSSFLLYVLGRDVADRTTGLVAVCLLATAPLFVLSSSVFLPYAPTTFWNLAFAVAYLRAVRRDSRRYAVAAGVAVGVAFFARPYTAVVFAAPFIAHTLWRLWRGVQSGRMRRRIELATAISVPGLCFVALTLAYNAVVTGSATTFPYQAFAPRDGLGFGEREILGYTEQYTPALGVEAAVEALSLFVTAFAPLGVLGVVLAAAGVSVALREAWVDQEESLVVFGLVPAVVLGNVYFWGTLNGLRNGLIDLLGPFYHFDLLVPVSLFGAVGLVTLARRVRAAVSARLSPGRARLVLVLCLVCAAPVVASAERAALSEPWAENRQRTENLGATYEPFHDETFDDALVYTPDPYGDWQQHPFQYLRNDPGFDGSSLYVLDEGPDADVRALDATTRTPYRFTYRGEWTGAVTPVEPELTRLRVLEGERVSATSRFGAPDGATSASIRLETESDVARYRVDSADGRVSVAWDLSAQGASVTNHPQAAGPTRVDLPSGASEVDLVVRFATVGGASVTYRQEATVSAEDGRIRVLWPPETRVCRLRPECGTEGTWVGPDGEYLSGVSVETAARVATTDS
jgi:4-amino-4-deoxy-L-arabinose transferase-like glycosyltransferase